MWRLLRRSLHMLQQEGYQTTRFLRWWLTNSHRVLSPPSAGLALAAGLSPPLASAVPSCRWLAPLIWSATGALLARRTVYPAAKKPLVVTHRVKRLLAGLVGLLLFVVGAIARLNCRTPARLLPTVATALPVAALAAPVLAAIANLLLFPVEEAFRRYYLWDAGRRLRNVEPLVVAVAGSYGKTTTKELIAAVLGTHFNVLKPPGSHNTPMGIARVLREQLRPEHEVFVAELGDHVVGDIAFLCRLLRPKVGVLATLGPEHLERFGSIANVVASKRELLAALPPDGIAVLNADDELARGFHQAARVHRTVRYGVRDATADVRALDVRTTRAGLAFTLQVEGGESVPVQAALLGEHNVSNLLAAAATAHALGLSPREIAVAIGGVQPVEHRLQPIHAPSGV
ncbi:MAG: hypothetical protein IT307_13155, partial [Chloroflexi bacterium]|nr:hypothetical protein [Chloroflexota bacterium]